ncbi:nucleoside diphosphate kinase 2, chloroplastic-like [Nicotiana tabacum]|uniref:Nucleoside diphosphate kinase n=2 Tax=Nicotiana TaxID=4085 RepID=A0A1S4D3E6_TOBAC|nr:PREDICTED: nucleoside diphosphate kinase 2, chloroplastic-like [Nicotiana sylvestris]XP_016507937.1 PREDICTED: nucleoside diphosphate kinase 2, chloroplastic-like [Nicotiana tabacum]
MEGLTIVGANPFVSSLLRTPSSKISNFSCSLIMPNAVFPNHHLAALRPAFHLFSYAPKRHHRPPIFLPHLVASMEEVEQTYIMIKPDGVQRGLVGEIISRFERKGFKLTGLKLFQCPKELAEEHYKDLQSKPFFPKLIDYITSGPVVCMGWEGVGVVASARKLIGATNPLNAEPGTIRGDLAVQTGRNVVHGSDSPDNGKREIALWFKEGELCAWAAVQEPWLME